MKKKYLIALVVILLIVVVGGILFATRPKQSSPDQLAAAPGQPQNTFSSIQDALSKSISLSCDFTDENGRKTQTYIKNGAVRADITAANPQESGSTIMKDKKIYFWNDSMAMVMNLPDITPAPGQPAPKDEMGHNGNSQEDMLKEIEKYKDSCKPAVVADSLFTPPSDKKFVDYSSMMTPQGAPNAASGSNPQMPPQGASGHGQNYQQMMQQNQK